MKVSELFENIIINESATSARIQHAEDLIFQEGSQGALRAVEALKGLEQGRHKDVTIKWDGKPAVVFGRNNDGEFVLTDKSGFTAKSYDGKPTSSKAVQAMFDRRRPDDPAQQQFSGQMANLYNILEKNFPKHIIGYMKGDLLYFDTPQVVNNNFVFTPNVVTYTVNTESELGQQIAASNCGIVVHRFATTDGAETEIPDVILNQLQSGEVLYFPPVTVEHAPNINDAHIREASELISRYGAQVDDMFNAERITRLKMKDLPIIFYTYVNQKVDTGLTGLGSDFVNWLQTSKVSLPKQQRLQEYLQEHQEAFNGMWQIINKIIEVKNDVIQQFDSNNSVVQASINNTSGGEGYVLNHGEGDIKLVNRAGFTAANRQMYRENKEEMCPEACCGKPVSECKCGPECKHCDCYEKNKTTESLHRIQELGGIQ